MATAVADSVVVPNDAEARREIPVKIRALRSVEWLERLDVEGRRREFAAGRLSRSQCFLWASNFPDEPPVVNGEYPWVLKWLADLE